jgi:hypothetical protein
VTCIFNTNPEQRLFFSKVDFTFLLEGATLLNPLSDDGLGEYQKFVQKPKKRF